MSEIRGCDLVAEYLIKENVPYLFGYAAHGAVGLLDGVFNHQDDLKIIFPRIESAAGYMADAYFNAVRSSVFVYEWFLRDTYGVKVLPAAAFTQGLVERGIISLGMG